MDVSVESPILHPLTHSPNPTVTDNKSISVKAVVGERKHKQENDPTFWRGQYHSSTQSDVDISAWPGPSFQSKLRTTASDPGTTTTPSSDRTALTIPLAAVVQQDIRSTLPTSSIASFTAPCVSENDVEADPAEKEFLLDTIALGSWCSEDAQVHRPPLIPRHTEPRHNEPYPDPWDHYGFLITRGPVVHNNSPAPPNEPLRNGIADGRHR